MTVDLSQGMIWIVGGLLAAPTVLAVMRIVDKVRGPQRHPPLAEEIAKSYVTRKEWERCRDECRRTNDCIDAKLEDLDTKDEARAKGTHRRIDEVLNKQAKVEKQLGMLIGLYMADQDRKGEMMREVTRDDN